MKTIPMLMLLMTLQPPADTGAGEALTTLDSLRWSKRVILVFAAAGDSNRAVQRFESFAAEIADRQIAWFVLGDDSLRSNYRGAVDPGLAAELQARYFTPARDEAAVVLIGKDGQVKSRRADLDLARLFDQIDAMPMRQQEMRDANRH